MRHTSAPLDSRSGPLTLSVLSARCPVQDPQSPLRPCPSSLVQGSPRPRQVPATSSEAIYWGQAACRPVSPRGPASGPAVHPILSRLLRRSSSRGSGLQPPPSSPKLLGQSPVQGAHQGPSDTTGPHPPELALFLLLS
ncbi:hypothetical protein NDU88_000691 [Pleurodeles waltl]|uniref:Uncharacterized protein n=1 Tax=Pleurodeles waltl TaxID=8319 RepID=A0AAV7P8Z4_PLEWA|nr:hypothetical protein NDU88_000691 [Pleurodeles waltl]